MSILRVVKTDITSLPSWKVCENKSDSGEPMTAIEKFIFDHEPLREADEWRGSLVRVIEQVKHG